VRVVVTGATGNIGTALLRALAVRPEITSIVGVARRVPARDADRLGEHLSWHSVDITEPSATRRLTVAFRGADAVIHLAWRIIADHDRPAQARTNRAGSRRVIDAVLASGVQHVVHLSSAAVYSPPVRVQ
jgi:UDP-glucose 4-epimerase